MNKIPIFCSSVFLFITFVVPGFADEHFPFLAEVSKKSVNVRAGPNTNFEKVDKLDQGVRVVVLGRSYEWLKVQPPATTKSYIRSDYLKPFKGSAIAVVLGDNVNVRAAPSSDAASLGEVKQGTLVKVLGMVGGWSLLAPVAGTAVWIHQDFLQQVSADVPVSSLIQPITTPEATAAAPVPPPVQTSPTGVSPWVSLRGKVEVLVTPLGADVHYELVLDDKSVFLLQDIPQIASFCNTVVDLEGTVVPDPQKKYMYQLLHINKIALVL